MNDQQASEPPYAAALRAELAVLRLPMTPAAREQLYGRVCDCVDGMRALDWPPERVIVTVKRIANDAGLLTSSRTLLTQARLTGTHELLVEMVGWCIRRYYDPTAVLA